MSCPSSRGCGSSDSGLCLTGWCLLPFSAERSGAPVCNHLSSEEGKRKHEGEATQRGGVMVTLSPYKGMGKWLGGSLAGHSRSKQWLLGPLSGGT